MRNPRDFLKPLAIGAPDPLTEIPFGPSRMIHFLDFSNEKMVAKVPQIAPTVDILLGNLEDAVKADNKVAAREGLVRIAHSLGNWPVHAAASPAGALKLARRLAGEDDLICVTGSFFIAGEIRDLLLQERREGGLSSLAPARG